MSRPEIPTSGHPLTWPLGWARTERRRHATFRVTFSEARSRLLRELERLRARDLVISTNLETKLDGMPYANRSEPADPGVAVYFRLEGEPRVLACDRWLAVRDNLRAIGLHVEAMRAMERWGVGSVEQAFRGYAALPGRGETTAGARPWREVLGLDGTAVTLEGARARFAVLARRLHPDNGGPRAPFEEVCAAWSQARAELEIAP